MENNDFNILDNYYEKLDIDDFRDICEKLETLLYLFFENVRITKK